MEITISLNLIMLNSYLIFIYMKLRIFKDLFKLFANIYICPLSDSK